MSINRRGFVGGCLALPFGSLSFGLCTQSEEQDTKPHDISIPNDLGFNGSLSYNRHTPFEHNLYNPCDYNDLNRSNNLYHTIIYRGEDVLIPMVDYHSVYTVKAKYRRSIDIVQYIREMGIRSIQDDMWRSGMQTIVAGGVNRNEVVFDDANESHLLTKRFISILKTVGGYAKRKIDTLLVGRDLYQDTFGTESHKNTICGVRIEPVEELCRKDLLHEFYCKELEGTLPAQHNNLVIGLDTSRNAFQTWERYQITCRKLSDNEDYDKFVFTCRAGHVVLDLKCVLLGAV